MAGRAWLTVRGCPRGHRTRDGERALARRPGVAGVSLAPGGLDPDGQPALGGGGRVANGTAGPAGTSRVGPRLRPGGAGGCPVAAVHGHPGALIASRVLGGPRGSRPARGPSIVPGVLGGPRGPQSARGALGRPGLSVGPGVLGGAGGPRSARGLSVGARGSGSARHVDRPGREWPPQSSRKGCHPHVSGRRVEWSTLSPSDVGRRRGSRTEEGGSS